MHLSCIQPQGPTLNESASYLKTVFLQQRLSMSGYASGSMIKVMTNKCEVSGLEFEVHNPCSKGSDHDRTPDRSLPASDQMRHAHAGVDCNAVIDASIGTGKDKIAERLSPWSQGH
jgi:hypothetical protein